MIVTQQELALEFGNASRKVKRVTRKKMRKFGQDLLERIRENASGPPGPDTVTGAYVESLFVNYTEAADSFRLDAGSDAPQAMRLEYGFIGTDARGARRNDLPRPHFRPAADSMEKVFEEELADVADLDYLLREA
jgi:hypothetical protein